MLIRNIDETPRKTVEMEGVVGASMAVMVGRDDGAPNFALRQFQVEPSGYTPRHSHDFEHEVFVVSGAGEVLLEGEYRPIRGGDVIFVPKDEEHQFRAADDQPLRFLCLVPMDRDCGEPVPGS
ncbi:MAG: cupin domain-containing protein [Phycisphaerales bacterium]|nr:cupin domain-containing protein [Phycisphaerales bacterium]